MVLPRVFAVYVERLLQCNAAVLGNALAELGGSSTGRNIIAEHHNKDIVRGVLERDNIIERACTLRKEASTFVLAHAIDLVARQLDVAMNLKKDDDGEFVTMVFTSPECCTFVNSNWAGSVEAGQ